MPRHRPRHRSSHRSSHSGQAVSTDRQRAPRPSTDSGMVTSEYPTGTVGASAVGCVVYLLAQGGFFTDLIQGILDTIRIITTPVLPFPGLL